MAKAFDQGYISFTHQGRFQLSEQLETPKTLGVDQVMRGDGLRSCFVCLRRKARPGPSLS